MTTLTKLWDKGYEVEPTIERFGAARNAALDAELARHDLWGSLAHARMLRHVGLLDDGEWRALDEALRALLAEAERGELRPATGRRGHPHHHRERAGRRASATPGKKLHTGRSRNDQVLVDLRLYAKEALLGARRRPRSTRRRRCWRWRSAHEWTPMPGYTHMQRAMLSSVGLWAAAYAEALLDDCVALARPTRSTTSRRSARPRPTACRCRSTAPTSRDLLGFARAQHNVLTAANARGKFEAAIVQALALVMLDLSKLAQDMLLFTTSEFGFFARAAGALRRQQHHAAEAQPERAGAGARAGAHRHRAARADAGDAGRPALRLQHGLPGDQGAASSRRSHICRESLGVVRLFAARAGAATGAAAKRPAAPNSSPPTAPTSWRVGGVPFRDAYRQVAATPDAQEPGDLVARLRARTAEGAPGNLELRWVAARLAEQRAAWQQARRRFAAALSASPPASPIARRSSTARRRGGRRRHRVRQRDRPWHLIYQSLARERGQA